jgi:hypothetical protein
LERRESISKKVNRKVLSTVMQENIRRIATFISITPSIPRAVRLSNISQGESEREVLGRVIWRSRVNGTSMESELIERSRDLDDQPWIMTGIRGLIRSQEGSDRSEIQRACVDIVERVSEDQKEAMTEYSNSLRSPASALFAIGVLLPILLATMIPIAGLSTKTIIMLAIFLWFGLPYLILMITEELVLKRPMVTSRQVNLRSSLSFSNSSPLLLVLGSSMTLIGVLSLIFKDLQMVILNGPFPGSDPTYILLSLIGISFAVSGTVISLFSWRISLEEDYEKEGNLVPELLSKIGIQLMEGRSIERSIARGLDTTGQKVPLFGIVDETSGPGISRAVMIARSLSSSGGSSGGKAVKVLSEHITSMRRNERSLKEMIRSNIGQMETTASILAPIMIGVSIGIFELMERSTSSVTGDNIGGITISSGDVTTSGFILFCGVYLLMISIVTTLSIHRLENGTLGGGWKKVPRNLIASSLMFTGGVFISTIMFGG